MKTLYLILIAGLLVINLHAQQFEWARRGGLYEYDYGYSMTKDNAGHIYAAGKYEQNANFNDTILPCQGNHDIWVAQYDSSGTLNWIRTAGGITGDYATGIACDNSYLYVAGEIEGINEVITFVGSPITLTSAGSNDIFLAKYDLNGNLLWARRAGGIDYEKALATTYDHLGNMYICGFFRGPATFGGTTTINSYGYSDAFVAKYDANGTFLWVRSAGSPEREEAKSIQCDAVGNVYICGMYYDGCVFGTQTLSAPNGYANTFLAKYDTGGTLQWVKTAGGDYDDVGWSLTIDNGGKLYVTGEFNAYALFDAIPLITVGMADVFVACYNSSGVVQWASRAGGPLIDRARGITTNGTDLFITGQFGATASFGTHAVTAADSSDIFVAAISNAGNFSWAMAVGGPADAYEDLGYESGNALCATASGSVYATGALLDGGSFGTTSINPYSRTDVFITKISMSTIGISEAFNSENISVYPNPSNGQFVVDLNQPGNEKVKMTIYNYLGQTIDTRILNSLSKTAIDISEEVKGIYFLEIVSQAGLTYRSKVIVQ